MAISVTGGANNFVTPTTNSNVNAGIDITTGTTDDATSLNETFNQFLTLLTTQLKNQDPLSPMDSTEFTNQLVSFSQVEQQLKTNDKLTKLLANSNATQTSLGLSYIGLNVDVKGNQFDYAGSGAVTMAYDMPSDASINTVNVLDANGNTVYTQQGALAAGKHAFTWDGTDGNGQQLPAGTYKLQVSALNSAQAAIFPTTTVPGYVTGVQTADDGTINLIVGKYSTQLISLSNVTQASL